MNIHSVAHYLKQGYRIRRASWIIGDCVFPPKFEEDCSYLQIDDLLADDWEVVLDGIVDDFTEIKYEETK